MSSIDRIVIVGAGLAGARAAEALRTAGYDGDITLLGEEAERPYLRPPLTKEYLRGEKDRESVHVHPADFYEEHRIDWRGGTAVRAIDVTAREVELEDGARLGWDRLLLATGARPRRLPVPGADLPGVRYLRTLEDADALAAAAREAARIVVVGTGWIGSEVAASLRQVGREVTLIGPEAVPLERVLGPEIGAVYRDLHREQGVDLRLGRSVQRIVGGDRVTHVVTTRGARIDADLVVVGIGAEPRTELAAAAGLAVGNGVEVSETLETSVPGIFAVGDIASAWHPLYGERVRNEHWATAKFQGSAVAASLLGERVPYDRTPYFYSDQFDLGMEYTGRATSDDRLVVRGSLADREFIAFWLRDGRVVAGMNANVWKVTKAIDRLIRSRRVVDPAALTDTSTSLDELAEDTQAA